MRPSRAGYSLFEVLVAFAIMALVLSALVPGQARLLGRVRQGDEALLAQDYAASVLDAAGLAWPIETGERTERHRDWTVRRRVTSERLLERRLHRIVVTVETAAGRRLAERETLRVIP